MKVRGFASLLFPESAGLCFERAAERAYADPATEHPSAWVIDERRIEFSLEAELTVAQIESHKRMLQELLREASSGEVYLDVDGKRWDARAAISGAPRVDRSGPAVADPEQALPTNRTKIVG